MTLLIMEWGKLIPKIRRDTMPFSMLDVNSTGRLGYLISLRHAIMAYPDDLWIGTNNR
jgi:hypothetical protein